MQTLIVLFLAYCIYIYYYNTSKADDEDIEGLENEIV